MNSRPPVTVREDTYKVGARLLGAVNALLSIAGATFLAVALTWLAERRFASGLWLLVGVLALRWILSTALGQWREVVQRRLCAGWRATLVAHFTLPQPERERGRGDLALAIDQASHGPALVLLESSAACALSGFVVLFWAGGWLTVLITVALVAAAVPLYRRAGRRSEATATEYQQRRGLLERRQLELLQHAPELRALGAVTYGANEIAAISDSEHAIAMRAIRVALGSSLVTEFISGVSVGLVAMVVGFALLGGRLSLQHALIAVLVTSEVFAQVRRFGIEFHRREDAERSRALLLADPAEVSEEPSALLVGTDLVTAASHVALTLTLNAGERLLITGPSGSGKTTLLHTLLGWRPAEAGTVTRTNGPIGHVSVESSLLSGSLRDNLTLGRHVGDVEVRECLSTLGLRGPRFENLDTALLPDGKGISAGEKVRLALARALLARPVLLVLDDIAGVLDAEGRRLVRDVLDRQVSFGVVEASVDTPLLDHVVARIELGS